MKIVNQFSIKKVFLTYKFLIRETGTYGYRFIFFRKYMFSIIIKPKIKNQRNFKIDLYFKYLW